jgi:hypothetical protein
VGAQVLGKHPSNHFRLPLNSFVRRLQRTGPYLMIGFAKRNVKLKTNF